MAAVGYTRPLFASCHGWTDDDLQSVVFLLTMARHLFVQRAHGRKRGLYPLGFFSEMSLFGFKVAEVTFLVV